MTIKYYNPYEYKTIIEEVTPEQLNNMFKAYSWLDYVTVLSYDHMELNPYLKKNEKEVQSNG